MLCCPAQPDEARGIVVVEETEGKAEDGKAMSPPMSPANFEAGYFVENASHSHSSSGYQDLDGMYCPFEDISHGGKPVYRRGRGDKFLFYVDTSGEWKIGPDYKSDKGFLKGKCSEIAEVNDWMMLTAPGTWESASLASIHWKEPPAAFEEQPEQVIRELTIFRSDKSTSWGLATAIWHPYLEITAIEAGPLQAFNKQTVDEEARVQVNDIILSIGNVVAAPNQMTEILSRKSDFSLEMKICRPISCSIKVQKSPGEVWGVTYTCQKRVSGSFVKSISKDGCVAKHNEREFLAKENQLQPGDVIKSINGKSDQEEMSFLMKDPTTLEIVLSIVRVPQLPSENQ